jgi:hypothetical protein
LLKLLLPAENRSGTAVATGNIGTPAVNGAVAGPGAELVLLLLLLMLHQQQQLPLPADSSGFPGAVSAGQHIPEHSQTLEKCRADPVLASE